MNELPTKDQIPSLSQLKADAAEIANLLAQAEAHVNGFKAAKDKITAEFASSYGSNVNKAARDQVINGRVMELRHGTRDALDALLKKAGASKARRDAAQDYLGKPETTVNVATLGDPKRSTYFDNLKNAGHASIRAAGIFAVANGDQPLVAAILDVLADKMPSDRPVSANDLLTKAPHPDYVAAKEAFRAFDSTFQRLILARRTFLSPTAGAIGRVKLALDEADVE